jgi:hypothetical protein
MWWSRRQASFGNASLVRRHVAERSVLHAPHLDSLVPFEVAGRKRHATCSGVAWFQGNHLAVANLYGGHLRFYRFEPAGAQLELLHEVSDGISRPEDVAVAPDESLLAITHSMSPDHGVSVHSFDARTLTVSAGTMLRRGYAFHGLNFSPDSRHLAFTEVGDPGFVEVVSVATPDYPTTYLLENPDAPMKPKAVAFSRDGRFVFIVKTLNVREYTGEVAAGGQLSVHRFDSDAGVIATPPLATLRAADASLGNAELCTVLPASGQSFRILVANQGADVVNTFVFNARWRSLAYEGAFASGLSFPHGVDASADGQHVAITNYGDDTLCIFRLE